MRLTRAGEYAVRCVLYLCGKPPGELVKRRAVAEEMDVPFEFMGKIAQDLAKRGILEIVQGSRGGFRLLRSPEEISLLDVVEAVMGDIPLNDCVVRPDSCRRSTTCTVHHVWKDARTQLRRTLKEATFAKMIREGTCLNDAP